MEFSIDYTDLKWKIAIQTLIFTRHVKNVHSTLKPLSRTF